METLTNDLFVELAFHLSYHDTTELCFVSRNVFNKMTNVWKEKSKRDFPELCGLSEFISQCKTDRERYLWQLSQDGVSRGSETFKSLNLCLNRALRQRNTSLVQFFMLKGAKLEEDSIKSVFIFGDLELIKKSIHLPEFSRNKVELDKDALIPKLRLNSENLKQAFFTCARYNYLHIIIYLFEMYIDGYAEIKKYLQNRNCKLDLFEKWTQSDSITNPYYKSCICAILTGQIKGRQINEFEEYSKGVNINKILPELIYYSAKTNQVDLVVRFFKQLAPDNFVDSEYGIHKALLGAISGNHETLWNNIANHRNEFSRFSYTEPNLCNFIHNFCTSGDYKTVVKLCDQCPDIGFTEIREFVSLAIENGRQNVIKALVTIKRMEDVTENTSSETGIRKLFEGLNHKYQSRPIKRNIWQVAKVLEDVGADKIYIYDYKTLLKDGHMDFVLYLFRTCSRSGKADILHDVVEVNQIDLLKSCVKILETENS